MGDDHWRTAYWRGFTLSINYNEGPERSIKLCWVAATSTFPSSPSPGGAQGLHSQCRGHPDHRATLDVWGGCLMLPVHPNPVCESLMGLPSVTPCGHFSGWHDPKHPST